jgi:hypothetical protein
MTKGSSSKKTTWKVIQKKSTETNSKASSIKSQESRKTTEDMFSLKVNYYIGTLLFHVLNLFFIIANCFSIQIFDYNQ